MRASGDALRADLEIDLTGGAWEGEATRRLAEAPLPPRAAQLRSWVVYRAEGAGWTVAQIVPAVRATVTVTAGRWAVTAADRDAVESPPVMVAVP